MEFVLTISFVSTDYRTESSQVRSRSLCLAMHLHTHMLYAASIVANAGVIFTPGSAGTRQEVFQDGKQRPVIDSSKRPSIVQ